MIAAFEGLVFRQRGLVLALLALFTLVCAGLTARLGLDTEIETHLPAEHEYIRTFLEYQEYLGTGRVLVDPNYALTESGREQFQRFYRETMARSRGGIGAGSSRLEERRNPGVRLP